MVINIQKYPAIFLHGKMPVVSGTLTLLGFKRDVAVAQQSV
jgi:hypothetical protein